MLDSLNALMLPALTNLNVDFDFWPWEDALFIDLRPLLEKTSALEVLDLDLHHLPLLSAHALPHLRTFIGDVQDSLTLCDANRPLHTLDLTLSFPDYDLTVTINDIADRTALLSRLARTPTLRRLFFVHGGRQDVGSNSGNRGYLPPSVFHQVATSCPDLTHLEICVDGSLQQIGSVLELLPNLVWIRLHLQHTTFASVNSYEVQRNLLTPSSRLRFIWLDDHLTLHMPPTLPRGNEVRSITFLVDQDQEGTHVLRPNPYRLPDLMRRYISKQLDI
ncbi:hypothetical protein CALCODRAFT_80934 [Calocera cornea HHB12733]|uniref:F-box domain-containing protein n=1 Tax=Calocera cornea HHB12733 TaxID=1353952 RepID=A0A165DEE1_9BASI|nr:hypothetical protein CALCODRAFT_80934 [Calocera cornea HHB12733]